MLHISINNLQIWHTVNLMHKGERPNFYCKVYVLFHHKDFEREKNPSLLVYESTECIFLAFYIKKIAVYFNQQFTNLSFE